MKIQDGTGSGYSTQVDSSNRLRTRGVFSTEQNEEAGRGNAYLLSSGFITLTSASESAVMYLRNDEDSDLVLTRFLISALDSTGGTKGYATLALYSNVTGMTSGSGNPLEPRNLNFGSTNELDNTSELGQEGASLINGDSFGGFILPLEQLTSETSSIILPKGASLGATITPPTGNTSLTIGFGINAHLVTQGLD